MCCVVLCAAAPYSALAKKFVRKWLSGYAFDPEKQLLRLYLSTLKPKPPKMTGVHTPDTSACQLSNPCAITTHNMLLDRSETWLYVFWNVTAATLCANAKGACCLIGQDYGCVHLVTSRLWEGLVLRVCMFLVICTLCHQGSCCQLDRHAVACWVA
jgi:hypothetical protein